MKSRKLLSGPYLFWAVSFIIIPLLMILYYGLTDKSGNFTLMNLAQITTQENLKALGLALLLSFVSTLICLILAYPLAMILSEKNVNQTSFIVLIFILPMWMNFLLRTLAWQNLLEKNGVINMILHFFHLPDLTLINTPGAIILGMVYNFLPFMVLPIYNVLSKIDKDVIFAARDLGANSLQTFSKIILPLSVPGIISGITMVFVPSLTTFVISDLLGGSKILLIGNVIEQEFKQGSNWNTGSGLSLVLMIFIIASMAMIAKYDKDGEMILDEDGLPIFETVMGPWHDITVKNNVFSDNNNGNMIYSGTVNDIDFSNNTIVMGGEVANQKVIDTKDFLTGIPGDRWNMSNNIFYMRKRNSVRWEMSFSKTFNFENNVYYNFDDAVEQEMAEFGETAFINEDPKFVSDEATLGYDSVYHFIPTSSKMFEGGIDLKTMLTYDLNGNDVRALRYFGAFGTAKKGTL